MSSDTPRAPYRGPQKYEDVDPPIRDVDGLIAVISRPVHPRLPMKKKDFAVAFFREYTREDEDRPIRTAFLKPGMVTGALVRVIPIVDARIDELVRLINEDPGPSDDEAVAAAVGGRR